MWRGEAPDLGSRPGRSSGGYCLELDLGPEGQRPGLECQPGIPLMNKMPFASVARLNGKPAGRPGPELIRPIVIDCLY